MEPTAASAETLKAVFRGFDMQGSGHIHRDQLLNIFQLLIPGRKAHEWLRLFEAAGCLTGNQVSYEPFIDYLFHLRSLPPSVEVLLRCACREKRVSLRLCDAVSQLCEVVEQEAGWASADQKLVAYGVGDQPLELQPDMLISTVVKRLGGNLLSVEAHPASPSEQQVLSEPAQGTPVSSEPPVTLSVSAVSGETCVVMASARDPLRTVREHVQREFEWGREVLQLVCDGTVLDEAMFVRDIPGLSAPAYMQDLLVIALPSGTSAEEIVVSGAGSAVVNGPYKRQRRGHYYFYRHVKNSDRRITFYRGSGWWPAAWYMEDTDYLGSYWAVPDQLPETFENAEVPLTGWLPWTGKASNPGKLPVPEVRELDTPTESPRPLLETAPCRGPPGPLFAR